MESTLDSIKRRDALKQNLDLERIRGGLNKLLDDALQHRGAQ